LTNGVDSEEVCWPRLLVPVGAACCCGSVSAWAALGTHALHSFLKLFFVSRTPWMSTGMKETLEASPVEKRNFFKKFH